MDSLSSITPLAESLPTRTFLTSSTGPEPRVYLHSHLHWIRRNDTPLLPTIDRNDTSILLRRKGKEYVAMAG